MAGAALWKRCPASTSRTWDFRIDGLVEKPLRLTWEEFNRLPQTEIQCDIHCVTRWSRFDNRFQGVLFSEVMKLVTPKPARPAGGPYFAVSHPVSGIAARFALVRGEHGFTANLPLEDLMKPTTIFAFQHDGENFIRRSRLSPAPDRAAPVFLEEREMGARFFDHTVKDEPWVLGAKTWLPHVRPIRGKRKGLTHGSVGQPHSLSALDFLTLKKSKLGRLMIRVAQHKSLSAIFPCCPPRARRSTLDIPPALARHTASSSSKSCFRNPGETAFAVITKGLGVGLRIINFDGHFELIVISLACSVSSTRRSMLCGCPELSSQVRSSLPTVLTTKV